MDSTIINAFRLSEHQRKSKLSGSQKDKVRSTHRAFREALVSELLKDPVPTALEQVYITKKTELPQIRFTRPIEIHQLVSGKRATCVFCRWSRYNKRGISHRIITKSNYVPRTQFSCSHCNTLLCRLCFWQFHFTVA